MKDKNRKQKKTNGSLLWFNSGDLDSKQKRGTISSYIYGKLSDADGFFDKVNIISFPHDTHLFHKITSRHDFYQISQLIECRLLCNYCHSSVILSLYRALLMGYKLANKENVQMIGANDPFLRGFAAMMLSKITGLPFVIITQADYEQIRDITGGPIIRSLRFTLLDRALERFVFSQADLVLADREYYVEYASRHGAGNNLVKKIGIAAHPIFYEELPKKDCGYLCEISRKADSYIMVIGRLEKEKYPEEMIEAFEVAKKLVNKDIVLIFAGDGPLRKSLIEKAKKCYLEDSVFLPGNLDRKSLKLALTTCDAVLAPCTGFALIEAALCASPIIAYEWEWHKEIIENEKTGIMAKMRDPVDMGEKLAIIIEDKGFARMLGRNARKFCKNSFSRKKAIDDLRNAYRLLNK